MFTSDVEYTFEGQRMVGYLAAPDTKDTQPGVLVIPDAGGLGEHLKEKARRLAGLGYVAFVMDMFGDGAVVSDGLRRIQELASDNRRWRAVAKAGLGALAARPEVDASRLAAIGYCFGGTTVYELARSGADLKGVVGFHSGLAPSSGEARNIRGKVLTLIGADDPLISPEARLVFERELRDAGVSWQMSIYGGVGHSFTNPFMTPGLRPGFQYDALADARSWAEMERFLEEVLG